MNAPPYRGRTLEAHYIKVMGALCRICERIGTKEAFEKAKTYAAQAERVQARPGLRASTGLVDCYEGLKNLSIIVFNDVALARRYNNKRIQAKLNYGYKFDADWERNHFPKQIRVPKSKAISGT